MFTLMFTLLNIYPGKCTRGLRLPTGTVYPKKYAHGFVVLCFVVVMQSFTMNPHEVSIHIHQGCFASTGAIVRLPQCQWSKLDGYGKINQCITTTKHSKAKTVCIFLGIYCKYHASKIASAHIVWVAQCVWMPTTLNLLMYGWLFLPTTHIASVIFLLQVPAQPGQTSCPSHRTQSMAKCHRGLVRLVQLETKSHTTLFTVQLHIEDFYPGSQTGCISS